VLGDDVGLDDVIPPGHARQDTAPRDPSTRPRPSSAYRLAPGDVLVATRLCVDDAAGGATAAALRACGVAAVVGRAFSAGFRAQALGSGLPALVIEEVGAIRPGDHLRVNIEAHIVANLSSGDRYVIRNIDEHELARLRRAAAA